MATETLIRAAQVIAYQAGVGHTLLAPGAVVVRGERVAWVGPPEAAPPCAETVDVGHTLLTPGFVNAHAHVTTPVTRSFREDYRNRAFYMSGLYEMLPLSWAMTPDDAAVSAEATFVELLRGGSTTVVVLGTGIPERVAEIAARLGIRAYLAPGYRSADWRVAPSGSEVVYTHDEARGERELARSVAFVREAAGTYGGLVQGFLGPLQVDTCSPALLRRTRAEADRLGAVVQTHAAQSLQEFQEIGRRHGRTPIEALHDAGLCGPDVSVAHAIFRAGHSWTATPEGDDLALLAASGTSVAHCPMVFARSGVMLESLPRYLRAGVRVALGTDTMPQDLLGEMRLAAVLGKIAERDGGAASAAEVFRAATLGGADLLGRADLGRIAPGAQADLLFFDLARVTLTPCRDPLRTLVYSASPADLSRVMVAGRTVVEQGRVVGSDEAAVAAALDAVCARLWAALPGLDWAGRDADALSPPSLPRWAAPAQSDAQ
jgi:5-methylthioadenosine/S-adenosylhomocysteine deaminase